MSEFYRAFEEQFRGPQQVIRARLEQYTPFLQLLVDTHTQPCAVDLGCGRGEWLDIVAHMGFTAVGVDIDADMLDQPRAPGISVFLLDGLDYLRTLPSGSQSLITAFHVVEHLEFHKTQELLRESFRVLAPGGLIIFETPNPENVVVSSTSFYLDPTHKQPLVPELLQFAAQFEGFDPVVLLRLQEDRSIRDRPTTMMDVLGGVSPDYSIVGRRPDATMRDQLPQIFHRPLGISLSELAHRFQSRIEEEAISPVRALEGRLGAIEKLVSGHAAAMKKQDHMAREIRRLELLIEQRFFDYSRTWVDRLLFRPSGKPKQALRRILFHSSGKPRGIFRRWVLRADGTPLRRFHRWMSSADYQATVEAVAASHKAASHKDALICGDQFHRTWLDRLLFRPSGKPKQALRRILFHSKGKPRGIFRRWVLRADGVPRRRFRRWMSSADYEALAQGIAPPRRDKSIESDYSPRVQYFTKRLGATRVSSTEG